MVLALLLSLPLQAKACETCNCGNDAHIKLIFDTVIDYY